MTANIIAKVQSGSGKIKKAIPTPFPKTDAAMLKWFTEKNNNDIAIDSRLFKIQAIKFSQELCEKELNGSDGFVFRWKKRHNVVCRTISGEAKSVDLISVEEFKSSKPESPNDCFNCDEAVLQYGVTAKKTWSFKGNLLIRPVIPSQ